MLLIDELIMNFDNKLSFHILKQLCFILTTGTIISAFPLS